METLLRSLRKASGMTQAQLADKMGISRPTIISIEKGERDMTLNELKSLAKACDVPFEVVVSEVSDAEKVKASGTTDKSLAKFYALVMQCIKYGGDDIDGRITKTKLAKLVYLCDFAHYYNHLEPITGLDYIRLEQGPVAINFFDFIDTCQSIAVEVKGNAHMISLNEQPNTEILSKEELETIQTICSKWKKANTKDIVDFTHNQMPWRMCKPNEVIPYTLINTEDPANVY